MDLTKVLQELREELKNLDAAISSLERLEEAGRQLARTQRPVRIPRKSRETRVRAAAK